MENEVKVKVISISPKRERAEIVVQEKGKSTTYHLLQIAENKYKSLNGKIYTL
jgi:hypothetical protein